jgi:hypothetical protein
MVKNLVGVPPMIAPVTFHGERGIMLNCPLEEELKPNTAPSGS